LVSISRASSSASTKGPVVVVVVVRTRLTPRSSSFFVSLKRFFVRHFFLSGVFFRDNNDHPPLACRPRKLRLGAFFFFFMIDFLSLLSVATNTCLSQPFSLARTQAHAQDKQTNQSQTSFSQCNAFSRPGLDYERKGCFAWYTSSSA
jgi:hypothetical protein